MDFIDKFGTQSYFFEKYKKLSNDFIESNKEDHHLKNLKLKWENIFSNLYKKSDLNQELFIRHSYLVFLIEKFVINRISIDELDINVKKLLLGELFGWNTIFKEFVREIEEEIKNIELPSVDIFTRFYQEFISLETRHSSGEFYTPSELARLMIDDCYEFGNTVLDPACGTGRFLVELYLKIINSDKSNKKKFNALNQIYGFDVNPIAVLVSISILMLILYNNNLRIFSPKIFQFNPLFCEKELQDFPKFDLIIGNPPWLVINSMHSISYKKKIKELARELNIVRGGKFATSIELGSILFARCSQLFLKNNGIIFFILPNAVVNGAQHAKFRFFENHSNIIIWKFDEDIFRINSICLRACKKYEPITIRLKIEVIEINCKRSDSKWNFILKTPEIYVPYNYNSISESNRIIKRLIPEAELENLLPQKKSDYSDKFYQGASLVPRNLFFVNIESKMGENLVEITPYMGFQSKSPWNRRPFKRTKIESKYIFKVVKSTDLIPFCVLKTHKVFLPIDYKDLNYYPEDLEKYAQSHFRFINNYFKNNQKSGAKIKDLWKQINHLNKLTNPKQKGKIKIVFNAIGSIAKGSVLKESVIIDTSLYYYTTNNLNEAYFLAAIINSPLITDSVKMFGSVGASGSLRNIHKHPLDFPIPIYNQNNQLHQDIAEHGQKMENIVNRLIQNWIADQSKQSNSKNNQKKQINLKPKSIQNYIFKNKIYKKNLDTSNILLEQLLIK
jgi:methylase of polypeptide subunit release factors